MGRIEDNGQMLHTSLVLGLGLALSAIFFSSNEWIDVMVSRADSRHHMIGYARSRRYIHNTYLLATLIHLSPPLPHPYPFAAAVRSPGGTVHRTSFVGVSQPITPAGNALL